VWQKFRLYKCKNDNLLKMFQESGDGGWGRAVEEEFKYDIFDTL
jgi:hypothetical protein